MAIIDWLSFTISRTFNSSNAELDLKLQLDQQEGLGKPTLALLKFLDWERGIPRKPYLTAFHNKTGVTAFMRGEDILIEISGTGCAAMSIDQMKNLISEINSRVTRIDIAADFEIDESPGIILDATPTGRMRSRTHIASDTGETVYIGSRKSEQYIRIYRYSDPHPRSHLLRVEYVARKKIAKSVSRKVLTDDLSAIYSWVVEKFKLPEVVGSDHRASEIPLEVYHKDASKTMLWLIKSVAPAMRRLIRQGHLDIEEFIQMYVDR